MPVAYLRLSPKINQSRDGTDRVCGGKNSWQITVLFYFRLVGVQCLFKRRSKRIADRKKLEYVILNNFQTVKITLSVIKNVSN